MNSPWMHPDDWRAMVRQSAVLGLPIEQTGFAPRVHPPSVLEAPHVRVEALTSNWCMGGKPVTPGQIYTVSHGDAERLVDLGKARRA